MNPLRRGLLAALLASSAPPTALAQGFPTRPIRVIVPFPAGGGTDIIAREVVEKIRATQGWIFVVENRPGSGGNLGIDTVAKSPADGYTIALGQTSNLAINVTLFRKLPYDPLKDLTTLGLVASAPLVFVVAADSPFKSLAEVVAAAKAKPGSLNFASPGNGTVAHLTSELFQRTADIKLTHVPYKGAAQALNDLIGGQVHLYASSVPTLLGQIKQGKLRALGVTSLQRVDDLPETPTIAESGYKGFESATWFGFIGPAGMPTEIINRMNAELNAALKRPELVKKLSEQGAEVLGGTPEQFSSLIKKDIARWAPVIKESGATVD
jgi:tripartite-type tricarboxylate transporter receptor subunit TctC